MITLICGAFEIYDKDGYPTGKKEFVASHGIDESGKTVIVEQCHPREIGAKLVNGNWIIDTHTGRKELK
jgi:hypothetical protein